MLYRIIFEIVIFALPFAGYGLYRLARSEAAMDGRKPWPINLLFGAGVAAALLLWIVLIFVDRGNRDVCYEPSRLVDGEMIPQRAYPCEKGPQDSGAPRERDPGGQPDGVGEPSRAGPG